MSVTRISALLVLFLLALPTWAQDYIVAGPRPRTTGSTTVNQFFVGARSEPGTAWGTDNLQYTTVFSDNYGFDGTEGQLFDVVGASGQLCNLRISQKGGTIDAADSGAHVRLKLCSGGDVSACTWTTTALDVTVTSDDTTSDVSWTDADCVSVTAGDAVALEWDLSGVASTVWAGGELEAPETYIEFRGSGTNESFITANAVLGTTFQSEYAWGPGGSSNDMETSTSINRGVPVPGSFTLTGMYVSFETDPGSSTTIYLCQDDAGTDANCDSAGTVLTSCTISTASVSNCSSTGLSSALSAGDRLYLRTSRNDANNWRAVGLKFTNSSRQWWSALSRGIDATNTLAFGGMASNSLTMCNQFVAEDPQCMPNLVSGATATAMRGWMVSTLSGGTLTVALRESAVTGMACQFSTSGQTCSDDAADGVLDAGDFISYRSVPSSASGGGYWSVSTLWNSQ